MPTSRTIVRAKRTESRSKVADGRIPAATRRSEPPRRKHNREGEEVARADDHDIWDFSARVLATSCLKCGAVNRSPARFNRESFRR